eukprot:m.95458 g.95458  ORF g.95458 m.95458 type:complete len:433 (+) comp13491_c0_seq6:48-1346(+)
MAWGKPSASGSGSAVDGWVKRLNDGDKSFTSLSIMPFRKLEDADIEKLCKALQRSGVLLSELLLSGRTLSSSALDAMNNMLLNNTSIQRLAVGSKDFGDSGLGALSSGLAQHTALTFLDLSYKNLTKASAKILANVVVKSKNLEELILSRNEALGNEFVIGLAEQLPQRSKQLKKLDLGQTGINADAKDCLSVIVSHVSTLILSANCLGPDSGHFIGNGLEKSKCIECLELNDCGFGDEGIRLLAQGLHSCSSLRKLFVGKNSIGVEGATCLAKAPVVVNQLETLGLRNNPEIGDAGCASLVGALAQGETGARLSLDLGTCNISQESFKQLLGLSCLEEILLFGNKIGGEDFMSSFDTDASTKACLKHLELTGNSLSEEHCLELLGLLEDAKFLPKLEALGLGGNSISDKEGFEGKVQKLKEERQTLRIVWK